VPFGIRRITDHDVIEVPMLRPYQPYDRLILRDAPAGRVDVDGPRLRAAGDA
jgi:hypothetical protein